MPILIWSEKYALGLARVDEQHHHLVDLINQLYDAMQAKHAREALAAIIDELLEYTHTHFALEEKYMVQYNYADFDAHRLEHDKFTKSIYTFQTAFKSGTSEVSTELLDFLQNWLIEHILKSDRAYVGHFKQQGLQ